MCIKKEHLAVICVIFIFLLPKINILLRNPTCLGWDCGFYLYNLKQPQYTDSFFFLITILHPFAQLSTPETTIFWYMILMDAVLLFGMYLLFKDILDFKWTLFFLLMTAFSLGLVRIWVDQLRNFFIMALTPYMFYTIKKDRIWIASIILVIMLASNFSAFVLLFVFGVYLIYQGSKKFLIPFILFILFTLSFFQGLTFLQQDLGFDNNNLLFLFHFNSGILMTSLLALKFFDKDDKIFLLSVIYFLILLDLAIFGVNRASTIISLPILLLSAYFFKNIDSKLKLMFTLIFLLLLVSSFMTINHEVGSIVTSSEIEYFKNATEPILASDRTYWFAKYYSNMEVLK